MIAAGAVAGVLVAGLLGFAVWESAGGRPYAELASCRDVLPAQVVDTIPGTDSPRAEGEYIPAAEEDWFSGDEVLTEAGYLGRLSCYVTDRDEEPGVTVDVSLFDHKRSLEHFEDIAQELEDRADDLDRGRDDNVLEWAGISVGDGGLVTLDNYNGHLSGNVLFLDVNMVVSIGCSIPEDMDDTEVMEFMEDFSVQVHRRLSRTSERV
ncbi:hypothetical protein [Nocardiopsis changdeensis]|uniref:hypothetical protein n=1 Tax=Nocardiopsis changdeensis TaxID=2831969 RepID=UPI003F45EA37